MPSMRFYLFALDLFNLQDVSTSISPSSDNAGPILDEAHVDEITSDDPTKLDEIVQNALEEKKRKEYSVCFSIFPYHCF
jgi:hypothetical protein